MEEEIKESASPVFSFKIEDIPDIPQLYPNQSAPAKPLLKKENSVGAVLNNLEKWVQNQVKEEFISGAAEVETTYGDGAEKIKEYQACYVFSPNKTIDKTKVSLTLLPGSIKPGIAKIEKVMADFKDNKIT